MIGDRIYKGSSTFLKAANNEPSLAAASEVPLPPSIDSAATVAAATAAAVAAATQVAAPAGTVIDPAIASAVAAAAAAATLTAPQGLPANGSVEVRESENTLGESEILSAIKLDGGSTMSELAKLLSTDAKNVEPIVVDLNRRDLVICALDTNDPRIELSETGALATRYLNMAR
jgi:hypothetical protein